MDITKAFGLDADAEQQGKAVGLGEDGVVYVARANSSRHRQAIQKAWAEVDADPEFRLLDRDAKYAEVELRAAIECLVLGWENLSVDGEELPYCKKNVEALMRGYDLFYTKVVGEALDIEAFRVKAHDEVISEVGNGSDGTKPRKDETKSGSGTPARRRARRSPRASSTSLN